MRQRLTGVLLLVVVFGLTPIAYASPVDPSFPGGFYDNGDFDDVILLLTSAVSVVESAPGHAVAVGHHEVGVVYEADSRAVPCTVLCASPPRAPPVA